MILFAVELSSLLQNCIHVQTFIHAHGQSSYQPVMQITRGTDGIYGGSEEGCATGGGLISLKNPSYFSKTIFSKSF